jgi:hypothetical protein
MHVPQIPQDDLIDVMEMTNKIEEYISLVLKENDQLLAISALIGASINSLIENCKTYEELILYRTIFFQILDNCIINIKNQNWKKPPYF